jgi:hypothetical protein
VGVGGWVWVGGCGRVGVQFDTQASMERMDKLPAVLDGYKNLLRYLLFVMIFFAVLYLQVPKPYTLNPNP